MYVFLFLGDIALGAKAPIDFKFHPEMVMHLSC